MRKLDSAAILKCKAAMEHKAVDQHLNSKLCPPFFDYFLSFLSFLFESMLAYAFFLPTS